MIKRYIDRTGWAPGPWDREDDAALWVKHKLFGFALRHYRGAWCGYAAVPPGHPLWGAGTDVPLDLHGHSGVNFAGDRSEFNSVLGVELLGWWCFGFDCDHMMDLAPGRDAIEREMEACVPALAKMRAEIEATSLGRRMMTGTYRRLPYVKKIVMAMLDQLHAARDAQRQ
jgi:hypothetical protein